MDHAAVLSDAVSRSMVDLQPPSLGSLGAELRQHEDTQSSEGWDFYLFP
jgi:hypothetical protein